MFFFYKKRLAKYRENLKHDMKPINKEAIQIYLKKLHQRGDSPVLIIKKLTIVDKFLNWAYQNKLIEEKIFKQIKEEIDKENLKLKIKSKKSHLQIKNLISNIKNKFKELVSKFNTKPNLSKFNPSQSFSTKLGINHYIGIIFFLTFLGFLGAGIYNQLFLKVERPFAYPINQTRGNRILSFQGRLTDSLGNPITTSTNIQFKLYNVPTSGTPLYTAGPCSIIPDQDGIFSTLIGSSCGLEIDSSIFTENANIYLGVTVGSDPEMTPRQPIANVGYAINAETLQGLPPGTGKSNIPFINQDGDLLIATASPGIRSTFTSADFTLSSAKTAIIQSAGSGDVVLQATQSGDLKFRTGGSNDSDTKMIIKNDGKVGIGTTTPNAKLEVAGDIYGSRFIDREGTTYGLDPAGNTLTNSSSLYTAYGAILAAISGNVGIGTTNPDINRLRIIGTTNNNTAFGLRIDNSDGASLMVVRNDGYLGIGTTAPGATLEVVGRVLASGTQGFIQSPYQIIAPRGLMGAGTGALTQISGSPFAAGITPYSVTVDPSGRFVYVANYISNDVRAYTINQSNGSLTYISSIAAGTFPYSVTVDPSGRFVYVANSGTSNVSAYTINQSNGSLTYISSIAAGTNPTSVTVDPIR